MSLTKYLIRQVMLSKEERMAELREFVPGARSEDWELVLAGQRVQMIKDTPGWQGYAAIRYGSGHACGRHDRGSARRITGCVHGGVGHAGILQRCFPQHMEAWEPKIKEMIPSYGISLVENLDLLKEVHSSTAKALGLSDEKHVLHV